MNTPQNQTSATYYDFPQQLQQMQGLPPQNPYHQQQQYPIVHQTQPRVPQYGSPQRRYLSEGELARQGAELSYARNNNTVDNIRELAGSPQRGVYMWKDTSPGFSNSNNQLVNQPPQFGIINQSLYQNSTSPTTQPQSQQQSQAQYTANVSAARYSIQQQQQQQQQNNIG